MLIVTKGGRVDSDRGRVCEGMQRGRVLVVIGRVLVVIEGECANRGSRGCVNRLVTHCFSYCCPLAATTHLIKPTERCHNLVREEYSQLLLLPMVAAWYLEQLMKVQRVSVHIRYLETNSLQQ